MSHTGDSSSHSLDKSSAPSSSRPENPERLQLHRSEAARTDYLRATDPTRQTLLTPETKQLIDTLDIQGRPWQGIPKEGSKEAEAEDQYWQQRRRQARSPMESEASGSNRTLDAPPSTMTHETPTQSDIEYGTISIRDYQNNPSEFSFTVAHKRELIQPGIYLEHPWENIEVYIPWDIVHNHNTTAILAPERITTELHELFPDSTPGRDHLARFFSNRLNQSSRKWNMVGSWKVRVVDEQPGG